MKPQLYQVFRTYWSRPLLIVIGLVSLCLTAGLFYQSQNNDNFSLSPQLKRPGLYKHADSGKWKSFLKDEKLDEIRSLSLHILSPDDNPDLSQLSELESLQIYAPNLTPELLNEIQSLKKLTSLSLLDTGMGVTKTEFEIPEEFFKKLGPQLQELDIIASNRTPFGDIKGVENLENLELLKISGKDMTLESFQAIKRLPRLKYLVIVFSVSLEGEHGKLLLELKNHPTLERIYASWFRSIEDGPASIRMLPLYQLSYSRGKVAGIQLGLFLMLSIMLILFLQLWSLFISPAAIVIPGYAIAHRRAAFVILGGGVFVTVVGLMLTGIAWLPAIAITLIIPTFGAMIALASQSRSGIIRGAGLLLGISIGLIIGGQATLFTGDLLRYGRYYAEFTLGDYPLFTCLLLITQLFVIAIILRRLPNITRRINERYAILPGFSPWDVEKQQRALLSRGSSWRTRLIDFRPRDVQYHQGSMWKQTKLWRLGNPFRPLLFIVGMLGMAGLFLIGSVYGGFYQTAPDFLPSFLALNFLFQTTFVTSIMAAGHWYRRCKHLELETMRPVGRKNLVRQLFLALAIDQSFAIIAGLFFGFFAISLSASRIEADAIYTFVFIFVAAVLWMYAIGTTIFGIKRAWVIWTVDISTCALLLAIIIRIAYEVSGRTKGPIAPYDQFLITTSACTITITAAIVMITFMYRKALQREWG